MSTRILSAAICIMLVASSASAFPQQRHTVAVPHQIVEQLVKDSTSSLGELLRELEIHLRSDGSSPNLVARPLDLNRDGIPELEIDGTGSICAAANCVKWIYRRTGSRYERLLDAGDIQTIAPQRTATHGYQDLMASAHSSAWDSYLTLYRFDGHEYRAAACYFRTYQYRDKRGGMRELKRARTTPRACS